MVVDPFSLKKNAWLNIWRICSKVKNNVPVIKKHLELVKLIQNLNEVIEVIIFTDFMHSYDRFAMG